MKNRDLILELIRFNQDHKLILINEDDEELYIKGFIQGVGKEQLRIVIDKK